MIPPVLDVDAARIHVATVLIEQGYMVEEAYQAAERIVCKCTAKLMTPRLIEETAPLLKTFRPTNVS